LELLARFERSGEISVDLEERMCLGRGDLDAVKRDRSF